MCGILGISCCNGRSIPTAEFSRAVDKLEHRGPDGKGMIAWQENGAFLNNETAEGNLVLGFGHTRLAIFDLTDSGHQPMSGRDGKWIIYNGEVYNFPELRDELRNLGHEFSTQSDTEVVLAAYDEWGVECVSQFNGMWALAIYHPDKNGIFISRDRLGIKPLYYHHEKGLFCFGSEIIPLMDLFGGTCRINVQQLARYILYHQTDFGVDTMYESISELGGGFSGWYDTSTGSFQTWRFWSLPKAVDAQLADDVALDQFSEIFEDAVRIRLRADVPVAITLSGGIDSSAVTIAASKSGNEITAFTSCFPETRDIDESAYARKVARACDAQLVKVQPDLSRLIKDEPDLTRHQALPFPSLSLYVHWSILSCIGERQIPVVLCGQGADELLMGYERYYVAYLLSMWPGIPKLLTGFVNCCDKSRLNSRQMAAYLAYFGTPSIRFRALKRRVRTVYSAEILEHLPGPESYISPNLAELQESELTAGQLNHLLRYDDRTAGAHGMETRLPFLDYRLVEFCYGLGWEHKIRHGWSKYLLRRYIERNAPNTVAWRKDKLGFNAPAEWTEQLIQERWDNLMTHAYASRLLKTKDIHHMHPQTRWDAYNIMHLAAILNWQA